MSRVFTNGSGDQGSIPGRFIPKTQKMVFDAALLNTQYYKVRVKWSNPGNGVVPSPKPHCSSYWKRSLLITFNKGCQLHFHLLLSKLIGNAFFSWWTHSFYHCFYCLYKILADQLYSLLQVYKDVFYDFKNWSDCWTHSFYYCFYCFYKNSYNHFQMYKDTFYNF